MYLGVFNGNRTVLTTKGMELLANTSSELGGNYWLGYFGLAYVPQEWKDSFDPVYAGMTKLTEYGDHIYNVWQGDYTGSGFLGDENQYSQNVKVHYRYKLDDNNINNLIVWERNSSFNDSRPVADDNREFIGSAVYTGSQGLLNAGTPIDSTIPIPAPLYYAGDVSGKAGNSADLINELLLDSAYTPTTNVTSSASGSIDVPRVSYDARGYSKSDASVTDPSAAGANFETIAVAKVGSDYTHWYSSSTTDLTASEALADELHAMATISNYNRYHTAASASVIDYSSEIKARNMAKVTKYFPVKNFSVLTGNNTVNGGSETRTVATGMKLNLAFDIAPPLNAQGWDENGEYDVSQNVLLANRYGDNTGAPNDLYTTTTSSFKFNRVGVYAVFVRKVENDTSDDTSALSSEDRTVYEIDPDVEPVLFAVGDFDNTQIIDEAGDPTSEFEMDFSINLSTYDDDLGDSSLVRDNIVFFNLYENNTIKYFKNQLLMNAQTMHSINRQSFEITSIRKTLQTLESKLIATGLLKGKTSSAINVGDGDAGIFAGTDPVSGDLKMRTISGVGISVAEDGCEIIIDGTGFVTSSARTIASTGNEKSLAYFDINTRNISSTGTNVVVDGTTIIARNDGADKYTDVGFKVNDINVTSNGLIETVVKKVTFTNSASGDPDYTAGTAKISLSAMGIQQFDLLKSISWEISPTPSAGGTYDFLIERSTDSQPFSETTTHDGDESKSGYILEQVHLNDPVDFAVADLDLKWEGVSSGTEFTIYVVAQRLPDEFNNIQY